MAKDITQVAIDKLKPGSCRREIPDGHTRGLLLLVQPTGKMSWALRYRFHRRPRKYTIGDYPAIGLKDARAAASRALVAITNGKDPAAEKQAAKAAARLQDAKRVMQLKRLLMISLGSTQSHARATGEKQRGF
jgi:Arm DNA-binding domain